jgi:uncharacterized FlaG/YvyC family protein
MFRILGLKRLIKEHNIFTREEMRRYVEKDWRMHEFSDYINNSEKKLSYLLSDESIQGCTFPGQKRWKEEKAVTFDNEKPHLWFDNFANIEKIQFNDLEIMQYKDLDVFKLYNHPPLITALKEKSGAPQELAFKREIYPVHDLVKLKNFLTEDDNPKLSTEISTESTKKQKNQKESTKSRKKKSQSTEPKIEEDENELDEIFGVDLQIKLDRTCEETLYQYFDDFDEEVIETSIPEVILDVFDKGAVQGNETSKEKKVTPEILAQTTSAKNSVNLFDNPQG